MEWAEVEVPFEVVEEYVEADCEASVTASLLRFVIYEVTTNRGNLYHAAIGLLNWLLGHLRLLHTHMRSKES